MLDWRTWPHFSCGHGGLLKRIRPTVSVFYDVLNIVVIDSSLNPATASERDCAFKHLKAAGPDDLILYDRGYPAFWLFAALRHNHLAFCMRAKTGLEKVYREFKQSGKSEAIIEMEPNQRSVGQCAEHGLSSSPIRLRLVRVDLPSETEVLVTNLLDEQRHPARCFKELYHLRWGVEETTNARNSGRKSRISQASPSCPSSRISLQRS